MIFFKKFPKFRKGRRAEPSRSVVSACQLEEDGQPDGGRAKFNRIVNRRQEPFAMLVIVLFQKIPNCEREFFVREEVKFLAVFLQRRLLSRRGSTMATVGGEKRYLFAVRLLLDLRSLRGWFVISTR
tara:strand:- start:300 stop:680 length:381 start_codon:yes stop_codon:yes gene_type:complete